MNKFFATLNGHRHTVEFLGPDRARIDGKEYSYEFEKAGANSFLLMLDHAAFAVSAVRGNRVQDPGLTQSIEIGVNASVYSVSIDDQRSLLFQSLFRSQHGSNGETAIRAPMPGLVVRVEVAEGEKVKKGQGLLVLEAMKMENEIKAPHDGIVKGIKVKERMPVEKGVDLLLLSAETGEETNKTEEETR